MRTLHETEKALMRYNEDTNAIELIWKGQYDADTYKMMFTKGVEYLKEFKATAWLSDIRKEGVVGAASSKWLKEEVIPHAIKNGLKKIAVILDEDVFKKFYVESLDKSMETKMMQYFDSMESAKKWLKEVEG